LKKNGVLGFPRGGKTLARGGGSPPPPPLPNETLLRYIIHTGISENAVASVLYLGISNLCIHFQDNGQSSYKNQKCR